MIYLNANNTITNPDLGFAGNYNDGVYHHAGFFRDASDGIWKVFDNYLPEPDANSYIDTTNTSFHVANYQSNTLNAGNTSTNWFIANTGGTYVTGTVNAASYTVGTSTIANSTGVYSGVVNATTISTGSVNVVNSSGLTTTANVNIGAAGELILTAGAGIYANGGLGSAGQVLTSNATSVYWASPAASGVTSVGTGNGLSGGPITSTGTVSVLANSGITANSTGLFVTQGTGAVVNSTGVHVNSTYIGTLSANNTTYVNGKTEGNLNVNSATYATSAGSATNATYATSAGSATNASAATNATYATSAGSATNASAATNATTANNVGGRFGYEFSWGHDFDHGNFTNFNTFLNTKYFGAHFVQGTTNGPGHSGAAQYYHQRMSLGGNYDNYSLQFAIPRNLTDSYLYYRNEEGGSASSWYKIRAGYADSAGSATNATYATSAGSATNATYATSSGSATNASAATNATYATSAGSSTESGRMDGTLLTSATMSGGSYGYTGFTSSYKFYTVYFYNMVPVNNDVSLHWRMYSGGAYQTASYYTESFYNDNGGSGGTSSLNAAQGFMSAPTGQIKNDGNQGIYGYMLFPDPTNTSFYKNVKWWVWCGGYYNSNPYNINGMTNWRGGTGSITGFQLYFTAGNISKGEIRIYGSN
jgi:hypothetical protein